MRYILAAAFFCASVLSAATTTVADTLYGIDEIGVDGTLYLKISDACTGAGGEFVGETEKEVTITSGAFTVKLVPNDTCVPANTTYTARFVIDTPRRGQWSERWSVPTSGSPVTRATVLASTVTPVSGGVGIAAVTGATDNSFICGDTNGLQDCTGLTQLGTANVAQQIIKAGSAQGTNPLLDFRSAADARQSVIAGNGSFTLFNGAEQRTIIGDSFLLQGSGGTIQWRDATDIVGANMDFQISRSAAGTLLFQNPHSSGATQIRIKSSSAQGGNVLVQFLDNSGAVMSSIGPDGAFRSFLSGNRAVTAFQNRFELGSTASINIYDNADIGSGNVDLTLVRSGAGILGIADASGNDLQLNVAGLTANRAVVAPDLAGTLVLDTPAQTITNKTIDGVDAGAATTRSNENNIQIARHNTDCTSLTDGVAGELCYEEDANTLYMCEPTAGGCDTAGEWIAVSSGAAPVLMALDGSVADERVLTAGSGIVITDGGANGNATVASDDTYLGTQGGDNAFTGTNRHDPSATQSLTGVGNTILCNRNNVQIDSDGDYTLTSTPTIADGSDGQWCRITNVDAAQTVTLTHGAANNLDLGGSNYAIAPNEAATLWWNDDLSDWVIQQVPGSGGNTKVKLTYYISPASARAGTKYPTVWMPSTSSPLVGGQGTDPEYYAYAEFAEGTGPDYLIIPWTLPSNWSSGDNVSVDLDYTTNDASGGNVEWDLETKCLADGESVVAAYNAAQTITATAPAANQEMGIATQAALTMTGCAASEAFRLRISRDDTSDTHAGEARLMGVSIGYYATLE